MADNNNIRVIPLFTDAVEGESAVIELADLRAVGNMSIQFDTTKKTLITYTASLNGIDYEKPKNHIIIKKASKKGILTFDPILAASIKIQTETKGTVNMWVGIQ